MQPELQNIPLNQIVAKSNYRKTFNDKSIGELAQSIKANGVLEPIIVRPGKKGFEIVAGERRFRGSQKACLVTIPAVIRDVDDAEILKLQIIENVQREGVQYLQPGPVHQPREGFLIFTLFSHPELTSFLRFRKVANSRSSKRESLKSDPASKFLLIVVI